jgi:hypothetical protein
MKTAPPSLSARAGRGETPATPLDLTIRAVIFLAADDDRMARFLALTGLEAGSLRGLIGDPGLQLAVFDHLASDERLLVEFAQAEGLPPEIVAQARRALGENDA